MPLSDQTLKTHREKLAGDGRVPSCRIQPRSSFHRSVRRLFSLTLFCCLLFSCARPGAADTQTKRILVITSYDLNRPALMLFVQAMRSTITAGTPERDEFFYEFQENTRISIEKYQKPMLDYLARKYEGEQFDAVIALGGPALKVLMDQDSIFAKTPKVFYFHDEREETVREIWPRATGVWAKLDIAKTLEAALAVQPDTQRVVVVTGNSGQDKFLKQEAQTQLRKYERSLRFEYVDEVTMDELKQKVSTLPKQTIVLYVSFFLDRSGGGFSGPEALSIFAPVSAVPVYGISETYLGNGIVGGSLIDFEKLGQRTGEITLRVLRGERAEQIPPETVPNITAFDWSALRRWDLDKRPLPPGSIVSFRTPTFWEQYKWYVLGIISALLIESGLIARLYFTQIQRRRAEAESRRLAETTAKAHRRLEEIAANVPGIVWETLIDPATNERKTTFISDYVEKMLGYTPQEWVTGPPGFGITIMDGRDREQAKRDSQRVIDTGKEGVTEFRWKARDGRLVWTESHLSPVTDADGKVIGLRGVTLDITERKAVDEHLRETKEKDRAILEAVPDLMFLHTRDGVYLDYHSKDLSDLYVPPEQFLGKNVRDVLPPDLADKVMHAIENVREGGEPYLLEYEVPLNGTNRCFEARMVATGDNMLSVIRDVTDRKRAEEAIKESEANYRSIFNAANDAIFVHELDTGAIIDVNERMCELYGCTPGQARTLGPADLSSNESPYTPKEALEFVRSAGEGSPQLFEWHARKLSGALFWVEVSLRNTVLRGKQCVLAIVRDITDRKTAEQQLAESHRRVTDVLESIGDAFFSVDKDFRLNYINRKAEQLWAMRREDLLGRSFLEVFPEFIGSHAHLQCEEALKTIQPTNFETLSPVINRWVDVSVYPSSKGLSVYFRDITVRKQALDKLRQSEEQFAKAFRVNPQPMSITAMATGRYLDVNESFLGMSGFTRDEVIGRTALELNVWANLDARADFINQINKEGHVRNFEARFRTKNGSIRVILASAELIEVAGEKCLLLAGSDITERIQAQAAIKESEARFANMADTAPVMIWVTGEDKGCTYLNQQWIDFTGRPLEQQLGHGWAESVHPSDVDKCLDIYNGAFEARDVFTMEYRLRRADGAYRWIIDHGAPRFSATGDFLGYVGSCVDITDRRESEAAIVIAHEALEAAYAEVNRLKTQLEEENIYLQEEIKLQHNFGEIIGQSDALKHVLFKIEQVAPTDSTVLVTGETGTGKELVARAIHTASLRRDRPMVRVNCAALSASLIESELFGHEKGSFTGAISRKIGRFELADGATIFLDEIGELSLELQVKLLRVIQEGELERLGGTKTVKVDVRVIAATNRNLNEQVTTGLFREDLWYRLNVFPITVPPLRQRRQDIPMLVEHFTQTFGRKIGKEIKSISPATMNTLAGYSWPGNVRELANVIERAVINSHDGVLRLQEQLGPTSEIATGSVNRTLEEMERDYIVRVLENHGWKIEGPNGAARILGLNPSTLRTRISKLGIVKPYQRGLTRNGDGDSSASGA
jgi:PAS domain S-box-containing protein